MANLKSHTGNYISTFLLYLCPGWHQKSCLWSQKLPSPCSLQSASKIHPILSYFYYQIRSGSSLPFQFSYKGSLIPCSRTTCSFLVRHSLTLTSLLVCGNTFLSAYHLNPFSNKCKADFSKIKPMNLKHLFQLSSYRVLHFYETRDYSTLKSSPTIHLFEDPSVIK